MLTDQISERVAKQLGLSPVLVTLINRVQWKFLLNTMQSGDMEGVSLIYLGKFIKNAKYDSNRKRIRYVNHRKSSL